MHTSSQQRAAICAPLVAALVLLAAMPAQAQDRTIDIPNGTVIPVTLDNRLSSASNAVGDPFTATVVPNDSQNIGLPPGTRIDGDVAGVTPQEGSKPGLLDLSFNRVRLPDGESFPIDGSLIGLDNKSIERTSSGRMIATPSHQNQRLVYAGYGAGAGLIVGLLTKHTLEDTLLGGGLGYLFGMLNKNAANSPRDVVLKPGTQLGVRLNRSLAMRIPQGGQVASRYNVSQNPSAAPLPHRSNSNGNLQNDGSSNTRFHRSYSRNGSYNHGGIGVLVGQTNVQFLDQAPPVMQRGYILVPARPVLDAANVPFTYRNHALRADAPNGSARIAIGSAVAVTNTGRRVYLGARAQLLNGTVYVPIRFLSIVTGSPVHYDSASRTVLVESPTSSPDYNNNGG